MLQFFQTSTVREYPEFTKCTQYELAVSLVPPIQQINKYSGEFYKCPWKNKWEVGDFCTKYPVTQEMSFS